MASEDEILISDLAESHPLTLNGNDTIIPIAHPDSGSETGYANMSTTPNQMGAYAVQSQTHANLKTSSKTVESSINQIVSNLAPDFSTSETYAVDAIVLYEGNIYKCIMAVETAGDWDSTKWTQIKVTDLESGGGGGSSTFAELTDVSLNNPQNGQVPKYNSTSGKWENANESGGGSGGHTIVDEEGTSLTQRTNLQFNGAYLEDNSTDDTTEVNIVRSMTRAEFDQLSADEKQGIIEITDESTGMGTWTDITGTLTTGSTSITLSNPAITTTSTIEVFNDLDVPYNSKTLSTGSITLTFDAQESDMSIKVRVS